jgi:hypothetical protein
MVLAFTKKQVVNLPDKLAWLEPYLVAAKVQGFKLPQVFQVRKPKLEKRIHTYASATVMDENDVRWNTKIIPNSTMFLHSHYPMFDFKTKEYRLAKFSRKTLLATIAHELAHLQEKDLIGDKPIGTYVTDHPRKWEVYHKEIMQLFSEIHGSPLYVPAGEWPSWNRACWVSEEGILDGKRNKPKGRKINL